MPMELLAYGDRVAGLDHATGRKVYRPVYLFGHKQADVVQPYMQLITASEHRLALSFTHYIGQWLHAVHGLACGVSSSVVCMGHGFIACTTALHVV